MAPCVGMFVGCCLALMVFLWVLWFSSLHKNQHLQIPIWPAWKPAKARVVSSLNTVILTHWMPFACHTRMQEHFICNLTTQIQCVFKNTMFIPRKVWVNSMITGTQNDWMWYLVSWFKPSPPSSVWELYFLPLLQAQLARKNILFLLSSEQTLNCSSVSTSISNCLVSISDSNVAKVLPVSKELFILFWQRQN